MGGVDAFVVVIATIFSIKVVIKVVLFCLFSFLPSKATSALPQTGSACV